MTIQQREREARSLARHVCGLLRIKPLNGQFEELVAVLMARTNPRRRVDYSLTKKR